MNLDGDYTNDIDAAVTIQLGMVFGSVRNDTLNISGTANLNGTLNVSLSEFLEFNPIDGSFTTIDFMPSLGDAFDILLAEEITGEFDLLTLATLDEGLQWKLDYLFDEIGTTDVVRLSVVSSVPVPPAIWLLGSGLLFLLNFSRRKY